MKIFVIDGYNVIHSLPEFERALKHSLRHAREVLTRVCVQYAQSRGDIRRIYLVFDGKDEFADFPTEQQGKLTVLFSTSKEEADGMIIDMLQRRNSPDDWWVVSRDNEIMNNAKSLTAKFISPMDFFAGMTSQPRPLKNSGTSSKSISESAASKITEEYRRYLGIQ